MVTHSFTVIARKTPEASPTEDPETYRTVQGAREHARARYGHRLDLTYQDVTIQRDGHFHEYAGPAR